ncbi:ABC transporter ATP-binding protein [Anoxybacteroides tepidamans]|uniref:ABC transporter ATP-binding protein n=1 Tax=Anoxybacteroides tepidamans TaxID=265948 RepID=UPI00048820C3|nr:ABC transporter ATP-binding protein [Anoxybacillus tepidamans]
MLVVNHVSKNYGNFEALKDIDLEFSSGIYGLLAPNGAGKTTLIKLLATLIFPSKGEILYNGTNISTLGESYREILGYLPQEFGYYKNFSPKQFLSYIGALKGIDPETLEQRIDRLLKLVALDDVATKKMKKFSGGMIQRVGIAQAMLNDPKILILDEPTAGLDPKERVRFRNLLSELGRDRIVILSTHIVSDVESIANEVIMLKDQKILYKDRILHICKMMEGVVYETVISYEQVATLKQRVFPLSERQEDGLLKVRFVAKGAPEPAWTAVKPNLEDVFLYVYRDEMRGEGAL